MHFRDAVNQDNAFYLKGMTALFVLAFALGLLAAQQASGDIRQAITDMSGQLSFINDMSPLETFGFILFNNLFVSFTVLLSGVFFGILPALFIIINGYAIGAVIGATVGMVGIGKVMLLVLPHGIFEIPALLLAASYGIFLGERFTKTMRTRAPFAKYITAMLRKFVRYIVPLLFIAAAIETVLVGNVLLRIL